MLRTLCARGCGCNGHPAFPTPFVGRIVYAQPGRNVSRECGVMSLTSLRANGSRECAPDDRLREAIHSCPMDCFASLAMTVYQPLSEIGCLKLKHALDRQMALDRRH